MEASVRLVLRLLVGAFLGWAAMIGAAQPSPAFVTFIRQANVVDVASGSPPTDQDVLIADDRIGKCNRLVYAY